MPTGAYKVVLVEKQSKPPKKAFKSNSSETLQCEVWYIDHSYMYNLTNIFSV